MIKHPEPVPKSANFNFSSLLGIRFILYQVLFNLLKLIFKNKSSFAKGILFDVLKYNSNLSIVETKHNEKFIIFNNDNIIYEFYNF